MIVYNKITSTIASIRPEKRRQVLPPTIVQMRVNGCKKCKTFGLSAWIREVQIIYCTFERKSSEIDTWNRNIVIAATFVVAEKDSLSQSRLERKR